MARWDKLAAALEKTRRALGASLAGLVSPGADTAELWDQLEELLVQADVGAKVAQQVCQDLRTSRRMGRVDRAEVIAALRHRLATILEAASAPRPPVAEPPEVIMVVGVNGTGKTTTIAKLAFRLAREGSRVLVGAADTFRAAAVEQLADWARRAGADLVAQRPGADPASVAFDAVAAAKARGHHVVILDTAGRLHTKHNLMEELAKVKRVVGKAHPGAPHQVLLVVDATLGQNSVAQAAQFHRALGITGLVVTKLDGTAKGGVVVPLALEVGTPVVWLGVGEALDDLEPFDPRAFAEALVPSLGA